MKNIGKLAVLGAVLTASASFAFGDTITLGSFATGQTAASFSDSASQSSMSYVGFSSLATPPVDPQPFHAPDAAGGTTTTFALAPNTPVWTAALPGSTWVGIASTAGPANTVNPPYGYYTFTTSFTAVGGLYNGSLNVAADDTVEVFLNGTDLAHRLIGFGNLGGDLHCADGTPNCSTPIDTLSLSTSLNAGNNTLYFVVLQAGNQTPGTDPSGVDFSASLTNTPEPSSLMLLGTGMVGAAGMLFRRRQATV